MELFADLVNSIWNAIGMEGTFELFVYQVLSGVSFYGKQIIRTHDVRITVYREREYKSYESVNTLIWFGLVWFCIS